MIRSLVSCLIILSVLELRNSTDARCLVAYSRAITSGAFYKSLSVSLFSTEEKTWLGKFKRLDTFELTNVICVESCGGSVGKGGIILRYLEVPEGSDPADILVNSEYDPFSKTLISSTEFCSNYTHVAPSVFENGVPILQNIEELAYTLNGIDCNVSIDGRYIELKQPVSMATFDALATFSFVTGGDVLFNDEADVVGGSLTGVRIPDSVKYALISLVVVVLIFVGLHQTGLLTKFLNFIDDKLPLPDWVQNLFDRIRSMSTLANPVDDLFVPSFYVASDDAIHLDASTKTSSRQLAVFLSKAKYLYMGERSVTIEDYSLTCENLSVTLDLLGETELYAVKPGIHGGYDFLVKDQDGYMNILTSVLHYNVRQRTV